VDEMFKSIFRATPRTTTTDIPLTGTAGPWEIIAKSSAVKRKTSRPL